MESWDRIIGIVTVGWKVLKPLLDSWLEQGVYLFCKSSRGAYTAPYIINIVGLMLEVHQPGCDADQLGYVWVEL